MKYKQDHFAFTLVELIVAITISVIVLVILVPIVSNTISAISYSSKSSDFLVSFNAFRRTIDNYHNLYSSGVLISSTGADAYLFLNDSADKGVLLGVVNNESLKLDGDYQFYEDKSLAFKEIQGSELAGILVDTSKIYDVVFQGDKVFNDIKIRSLDMISYNTGAIIDSMFEVNINYTTHWEGKKWSDIPSADNLKINLNF